MKKPDYHYSSGKCVVVTIEAIYEIADGNEAEHDIEQMRQYGAAEIISRRIIADSLDDAHRILRQRVERSRAADAAARKKARKRK